MRTRSQSRRHRQQQVPQTSIESPNLEKPNNNQESPVVTMVDNRTMAELLQAPTEGYEDAIFVPAITSIGIIIPIRIDFKGLVSASQTPAGRVILFGTIPTTIPDTTPVITPLATQTDTPVIPTETPIIAPTIPPSPDYTPASPDYSPASDSESDPSEDPSSDNIPPLPAISPFLSSDDDSTDNDTPDTPSSPTHDTPFTEITAST
ncbi:hypothetical protein Tco_0879040 [Tanacetum coccineum]